ncbi:DUF3575 domain-containing protein [Arcticibacter tournemirensis]|uniref:DUF3575 domain-containing protein n=1 Tax=Arcticibacter tournemirensis TaxID=699437 RepID=A0A4Q0M2Z4_9SPHI|nr:DUF3575 domain-containing protein [Arcticibacter tournemirensis]RXF67267.1 DUF3575 domain-containing protein [Arcticibacter tournemirensis]
MKQIFTTLFLSALLFTARTGYAQFDTVLRSDDQGKNLLKINVPAIAVNNFSIQYERAVGKKISAGLSFRFMPKSGLPLKSQLENLIDDDDTWYQIQDMKTSNFAFTPEVRFYFGKSVFRGFYVAPFAKIAHYTADLPDFEYDVDMSSNGMGTITETIPLSARLNTVTGGVLLGAQWKLSKVLYLDWWIFGPQYGWSKGHLTGTKDLNEYEQQALKEELEDLDIPLVDTKTEVDSKGARLDMDGPWAGLRAGINLGVRF